jgi:hypothetical protein
MLKAVLSNLVDSPHLYYMHFWDVGAAADVAAGLHDALTRMNVKQ